MDFAYPTLPSFWERDAALHCNRTGCRAQTMAPPPKGWIAVLESNAERGLMVAVIYCTWQCHDAHTVDNQ